MIRFLKVLRPIATVVLFFVCWQFFMVSEYIAWAKEPPHPQPVEHRVSVAEKFGKKTEELEGLLEKVRKGLDAGQDVSEHHKRIAAVSDELETLNTGIEEEFAATGKKLAEINAAPVIHERQKKALAEYREKFKEMKRLLASLKKNKTRPADLKKDADDLTTFLKANKPKSRHLPLDPNNLPHRAAKAKKIIPKQTREEYEKDKRFKSPEKKQHGWNQVLPKDGVKIVSASDDLSGLFSVAQATPTGGIPAPTPEDLAPTIDAQLTDAIRAKAAELGNQPLPIYQWVRNNIEFVPTYGSIQGADYCLQTKQCNAFDTSSLLIALLRASGIHARYVYGTIEIPADKAMNWVGGVTKPELAVELLNMGGIPAVAVVSGSQITKVRLEHMWVEAWIDYVPSRGAVHRVGDNWIPMDASWKQYTYTQGTDLAAVVPFDGQALIDLLASTAVINDADGWVTGISSSYIGSAIGEFRTRIETYLSQNIPNATLGEVLGKKEIVLWSQSILSSMIAYKQIELYARLNELPDSLRQKITFEIRDPSNLREDLLVTKPFTELAGKELTFSYRPATTADNAVLGAYLPKPHSDGSPILPSEVPGPLAAYLISLVPELRANNTLLASGQAVGMGNDQYLTLTITSPNLSSQVVVNQIASGEYSTVAFAAAKGNDTQLLLLKAKLEETKARIDAVDFSMLTKEAFIGDLLYAILLSYFSQLDMANQISSLAMGVALTRLCSTGRASTALRVDSAYGIPLSASVGGVSMDIGLIQSYPTSLKGDRLSEKHFMAISGIISSGLESSVPAKILSTPTNEVEGISAVRALQLANDQNTPIYIINQTNANKAISQLDIDADVINDIQNAVAAGKIVTISKGNVTLRGWTGCGYIVADPSSGAAAYMISGGLRGSFTIWDIMILTVLAVLASAGFVAIIALLAMAILPITGAITGAAAAISALAGYISDIYLAAAIRLMSLPWIRALYEDLIAFAQVSPPPYPFPTDVPSGVLFLWYYFRVFLLNEYLQQVRLGFGMLGHYA